LKRYASRCSSKCIKPSCSVSKETGITLRRRTNLRPGSERLKGGQKIV
jgi:hypothetical protein